MNKLTTDCNKCKIHECVEVTMLRENKLVTKRIKWLKDAVMNTVDGGVDDCEMRQFLIDNEQ